MDLWIRTQSKEQLLLAQEIKLQINTYDGECQILIANKHTYHYAGKYKTKERALEILDEIQNMIKQRYICNVNCLLRKSDIDRKHDELLKQYPQNEFIMSDETFTIKPINSNVIVYELPKE